MKKFIIEVLKANPFNGDEVPTVLVTNIEDNIERLTTFTTEEDAIKAKSLVLMALRTLA